MLAAAAFFPVASDALVLGEIQVNSHLGQPLNAQIPFVDIADLDVSQLKIRLASAEEYRKLGLQYPEGVKFLFRVVNEPGALAPFVRVFTSRPIDEPYLNLLLEIREPSGTLSRAYTFLLDPPQDGYSGVDQASIPEVTEQAGATHPAPPLARQVKQAATSTAKRKKPRVATLDRINHMKLAMSLSISSYEPGNAQQNSDALQEELIAKEKTLEDLKSQVGEMQGVIRALESRLGPSDVAASAVPGVAASDAAASGVPEAAASSAVPEVVPQVQAPAALPATPATGWLNPLLAFCVLLLGGAALVGYRKYRQMHAWHHGTFDEFDEAPTGQSEVDRESPAIAEPVLKEPALKKPGQPKVDLFPRASDEPVVPAVNPQPAFGDSGSEFGERSIETPAYAEQPSSPTVPPEYTLLLEANRYMRSGKEAQAEEALLRAIDVNPKNPYGYQALLKIYSARSDRGSFEQIARRLGDTGDQAAFEEAAEIGRKLDPDNPLYA